MKFRKELCVIIWLSLVLPGIQCVDPSFKGTDDAGDTGSEIPVSSDTDSHTTDENGTGTYQETTDDETEADSGWDASIDAPPTDSETTTDNSCSPNPCLNSATCTEKLGGYTCECEPDYEGTRCEQRTNDCIDEPCQNEGVCVDGIETYSCTCPLGLSGLNCERVVTDCASAPCLNGGQCTDVASGYECSCSGYRGTNCETPIACGDGVLDTTEVCDDGGKNPNDGCSPICELEEGYSCDFESPSTCDPVCGDGFVVGSETGERGCDDKNDVVDDGCVNCVEQEGWVCSGAPSVCEDIDECATDNGLCGDLVQCTNTPGGHYCGDCPKGYTGTAETGCVDIDECLVDNGGCDPAVDCENTLGSRECGPCPPGYTGDSSMACVSACEDDNGGCDPLTQCSNTEDGIVCSSCPLGYTGTGAEGCVSECNTNNGGCDPLRACINTSEGITCDECPVNYVNEGETVCVSECSLTCTGLATVCSGTDTCNESLACELNHLAAGATPSGCDDPATVCSEADSCDGEGNCDFNHYTSGETPSGCNGTATICSAADKCDGEGNCDFGNLSAGTKPVGCATAAGSTGGQCISEDQSCDGLGNCLYHYSSAGSEGNPACPACTDCDGLTASCTPVQEGVKDIGCDGVCRVCNASGSCINAPSTDPLDDCARTTDGNQGTTCLTGLCNAGSCATTAPITCYRDLDLDGFGDPNVSNTFCFVCPAGWDTDNTDCYDLNENVKPIPADWHNGRDNPGERGDGSWDYDCDGVESRRYATANTGCTSGCPSTHICTTTVTDISNSACGVSVSQSICTSDTCTGTPPCQSTSNPPILQGCR